MKGNTFKLPNNRVKTDASSRNICLLVLTISCVALMTPEVRNQNHNEPKDFNILGECKQQNLEHYDLSFLKLSKLLSDGDIESHPGPVTNTNETPKRIGRPPKRTRFGFNKSKNIDIQETVLKVDQINEKNPTNDMRETQLNTCTNITKDSKIDQTAELNVSDKVDKEEASNESRSHVPHWFKVRLYSSQCGTV